MAPSDGPGPACASTDWTRSGNTSSTSAAARVVAPSTQNSIWNEWAARKPPSAGPTLIPRLIASRLSANACRCSSGGARSPTRASVAGRIASDTAESTAIPTSTWGMVRSSGSAQNPTPPSSSETVRMRCEPTRSARRPAKGEVSSETTPYTASAAPACAAEKPRFRVKWSARNGMTIVPARFTRVARASSQLSRGRPARSDQGLSARNVMREPGSSGGNVAPTRCRAPLAVFPGRGPPCFAPIDG